MTRKQTSGQPLLSKARVCNFIGRLVVGHADGLVCLSELWLSTFKEKSSR